jgi:hypothetical protein
MSRKTSLSTSFEGELVLIEDEGETSRATPGKAGVPNGHGLLVVGKNFKRIRDRWPSRISKSRPTPTALRW